MKTSKILTIGIAAATLSLAACRGTDSSGPVTIEGIFTLKSVNGSPLPFIINDPAGIFQVNFGDITITSGNTFSSTINFTVTIAGQATTTNSVCTGTFTQNGNRITFIEAASSNADCGGGYIGSLSNGTTLTIAYDATLQAVYQK